MRPICLLVLIAVASADAPSLQKDTSTALEATFVTGIVCTVLFVGGIGTFCMNRCCCLATLMTIFGAIGAVISWVLYAGYTNCWGSLCNA